MNYKLSGTVKRNKTNLIIFLILWIFLAIVLIAPMVYSYTISRTADGILVLSKFIENISFNPLEALVGLIQNGNFEIYLKVLGGATLFYAIFLTIGLIRTAPKHQYSDIEHGSSDWSKGGEQYQILSNKEGIILGEKNYLPVDKRGNVNVLVVGRFWIW